MLYLEYVPRYVEFWVSQSERSNLRTFSSNFVFISSPVGILRGEGGVRFIRTYCTQCLLWGIKKVSAPFPPLFQTSKNSPLSLFLLTIFFLLPPSQIRINLIRNLCLSHIRFYDENVYADPPPNFGLFLLKTTLPWKLFL